MNEMQKKTVSQPDDTRTFDKGQVDLVSLGGVTFGRATLQPGWKWSTCVKPLVRTNSCQALHLQYHMSGRLQVVMDDGSKQEFGPGDVALIPPGHDAWVVGNDPVVVIDISGMGNYAQPASHPDAPAHFTD
jgi:mannose-6-phosphate isomerase-like protein (cupin superfamily)